MGYVMGIDKASGSDSTHESPVMCLSCGIFSYACFNIAAAMAHTRKWQGKRLIPCWRPRLVAGVRNERGS